MQLLNAKPDREERELEVKGYALRAVFWAIRYHCFTLLDRIAERMNNSELNCATLEGMSPLDYAAFVGNYDALRTL